MSTGMGKPQISPCVPRYSVMLDSAAVNLKYRCAYLGMPDTVVSSTITIELSNGGYRSLPEPAKTSTQEQ